MLLLVLPAGCARDKQKDGGAKSAPEAGFVVLRPQNVPLRLVLPGRTTAFETSEVRPQVSGILRARLFTEGATVHEGEVLYRIDARVYESAAGEARADLASAVATRDAARARANRFAELAKSGVVSKQDLLDAQAAADVAVAAAERARAGLAAAELNLGFTEIRAPITGRIGRSVVTTGALVHSGQAAPLTTIQRLDPMFVDIQQSSSALLGFPPAARRRRADAFLHRGESGPGRRQPLPACRGVAVRRVGGGSGHGHGHAARAFSESGRPAAARHVRARGVLAGGKARGDSRAPAGDLA